MTEHMTVEQADGMTIIIIEEERCIMIICKGLMILSSTINSWRSANLIIKSSGYWIYKIELREN